MTLDTLLLLQRILDSQQMFVGAPDFEATAMAVLVAKAELRQAIEDATRWADGQSERI